MNYIGWTRYASCMYKVKIKTSEPCVIRLIVKDKDHANTEFMNRTKNVNGEETLYVRMPISPNVVIISVFNEKNGNKPYGEDKSITSVEISKEDLQVTLHVTKMDTPLVRAGVRFLQKFALHAGWIGTGLYYSKDKKFKIEYLPFIKKNSGEKTATPARVSMQTGRIEVSQQAFLNFTVPERMAILAHEFSHYYLNSDVASEVEADLNGLAIYMGLGYPIYEGYKAFDITFIGYPTKQNLERRDIIDRFIKQYISEHKIEDVYTGAAA